MGPTLIGKVGGTIYPINQEVGSGGFDLEKPYLEGMEIHHRTHLNLLYQFFLSNRQSNDGANSDWEGGWPFIQ